MITLLLQFIFVILAIIAFTGSLKSLLKGINRPKRARISVFAKLDNVYRFMSGIYLGFGVICLWMVVSMPAQNVLVYLIALTIFLAGMGRVLSIRMKGLPERKFYYYVLAELMLPIVISFLQYQRTM